MSAILAWDRFESADARAEFAKVMEYAREHPGTAIRIAPGTYTLTSGLARETQQKVMRGEYGENPENAMFSPDFAFTEGISFAKQRGTTLLCQGVTLLVDGFMEPLCLKDCEDVRIVGLTVDYKRKPFSMGTIEACAEDLSWADIRFGEEYPLFENTPMPRYCAYDAESGLFDLSMRAERREGQGQTRRFHFSKKPARNLTGSEFYVWHAFHYRPAILMEAAKGITLRDVTIHSQPGMGIVGHRCEDITLTGLRVIPSPGLHMSTNTDATHFTSCKGQLLFEGCEFEGHGDDATNVHTFYHGIEPLGENRYRGTVGVRTHSLTADYPDAGDEMELTDKNSLCLRDTYRVLSCEADPKTQSYIATLDHPLPGHAENFYLSDVTRLPRLVFRACSARNHWARAVLIKTRSALVERCVFFGSALFAIHIAAEGGWLEGVACRDITVRDNDFIRCGQSGRAKIGGVCVEMSVSDRRGYPQSGITIERNTFDLPCAEHAVSVSNAEDVRISQNTYNCEKEPVVFENCRRLTVEDD